MLSWNRVQQSFTHGRTGAVTPGLPSEGNLRYEVVVNASRKRPTVAPARRQVELTRQERIENRSQPATVARGQVMRETRMRHSHSENMLSVRVTP